MITLAIAIYSRRLLARHGFAAVEAESGNAALAALTEGVFDLVLLDLMMPEMDGLDVLHRLKNDAKWRNVPVIMLSALDETSRVIQCLEFGAEDYVVKPFDPVLLLARLHSTLERSPPARGGDDPGTRTGSCLHAFERERTAIAGERRTPAPGDRCGGGRYLVLLPFRRSNVDDTRVQAPVRIRRGR